jgi:MFS family permease
MASGTFRALRHRNFRLYLGGMLVSVVGSWMQQTAQGWLVYRLTHSEWMLGLTWFCANIPVLLLSPVAGLVADRLPRRTIVIATQALAMTQAAILAALTLSGHVQAWQILCLALVLGTVNAFDVPGRQSLVGLIVPREDLLNAISLNSAMFNTARAAGPALAGILVAWIGEGPCFVVNALSFLAVIASLVAMRVTAPVKPLDGVKPTLASGFQYLKSHPPLLWVMLSAGIASFATAPASALGPIFADAIFHRGARGFGFLTSAMGIGAVLGTLNLARRKGMRGLPRTVSIAAGIVAAALACYALSPSYWMTLAVMPFLGLGVMRLNAGSQTIVQSSVPDEYRGRLMGLYTMMFIGMFPLGSLAAGALARQIGARPTVLLGSLLCFGAALNLATRVASIRNWVMESHS